MQRVDVQLEDDLTGGPADETMRFSIDGRAYEIDLSTRNAERFRRLLAPFVEHARLARPHRPGTTTRTAASRRRQGRLAASVVEQYRTAHTPSARRSFPARFVLTPDGGLPVAPAEIAAGPSPGRGHRCQAEVITVH